MPAGPSWVLPSLYATALATAWAVEPELMAKQVTCSGRSSAHARLEGKQPRLGRELDTLKSLIDALERHTPLTRPLAVAVIVVALFLVAWIASRIAARIAAYFVDRNERRRWGAAKDLETGVIMGIRQRETAISLIATSVRYLVFAIALLLSIVALSGAQRLQTVIGASFLAIVIGFAAQRFLMDVIAGLLMFFEGWFRIGDTVAIDALQVQGSSSRSRRARSRFAASPARSSTFRTRRWLRCA